MRMMWMLVACTYAKPQLTQFLDDQRVGCRGRQSQLKGELYACACTKFEMSLIFLIPDHSRDKCSACASDFASIHVY
jgi:hypothetical protein